MQGWPKLKTQENVNREVLAVHDQLIKLAQASEPPMTDGLVPSEAQWLAAKGLAFRESARLVATLIKGE